MKQKQLKSLVKYILREIHPDDFHDEESAHEKMRRAYGGNLDEFTKAYIRAALFTSYSNSPGAVSLDKNYGIDDIEEETLKKMVDDCKTFQDKYRELFEKGGWSDEQAGHDFWLTRNGHGTGFWDRAYGESKEVELIGRHLTKLAKAYGEFGLWLGDGAYDGLIIGGH